MFCVIVISGLFFVLIFLFFPPFRFVSCLFPVSLNIFFALLVGVRLLRWQWWRRICFSQLNFCLLRPLRSPCDFDVYYSGGRGRRVYRTDFRTGESRLICMTNAEVLDMALELGKPALHRQLMGISAFLVLFLALLCSSTPIKRL